MLEAEYNRLREFVQHLQRQVAEERPARVTIIPAVTPRERDWPRWSVTVPTGIALGLLVAVGLALALELLDTSVHTPRDIVRHVAVPVLGTVPDLDDEEVSIEQVETAVLTAPHSMVAEAFRAIRTNLLLTAPAERQRSILITSPRPEDGKTSVAVNLAMALVQAGRRVLLVDANFRRPALWKIFREGGPGGLSNILTGQATLDELRHPTMLGGLDVLLSGPIPPNPAELLGSPEMRRFIEQATDGYDQVIFDGPPTLLVSDALALGREVDGVVLVVRAHGNNRGVAQRARDQLHHVHARIFGAVLNAAQARRGGYFREQYRAFYDYRPDEEGAGAPPRSLPAGPGGDSKA